MKLPDSKFQFSGRIGSRLITFASGLVYSADETQTHQKKMQINKFFASDFSVAVNTRRWVLFIMIRWTHVAAASPAGSVAAKTPLAAASGAIGPPQGAALRMAAAGGGAASGGPGSRRLEPVPIRRPENDRAADAEHDDMVERAYPKGRNGQATGQGEDREPVVIIEGEYEGPERAR